MEKAPGSGLGAADDAMSAKGTDIEKDDLPLEDEEVATAQEAIPVPLIAGTRRMAVRWFVPAMGLVTQLAPEDRPGKK